MHIFRWDLDRTYLETEIDSVRGLVRAAFEEANEKRTVPGAGALVRALQMHDPASRLVVISGSPLQMRTVLEEKLKLDGIRVDRLILKDNLGNLRRGRFRAVRGQLGYKLPNLLRERTEATPGDHETLFGDDAEVDGLVYAVYAAALAGEIGEREVRSILEAGGAYPDAIQISTEALRRLHSEAAVEDIFIRLDRGVPLQRFHLLGQRVTPVASWFQAAAVLRLRDRLGPGALAAVAEANGLDPRPAASQLQDLVRRGVVPGGALLEALDHPACAPLRATTEVALRHLGSLTSDPRPSSRPDFLGFLRASQGS
ncbi:MAG: hypothetical protein KC621_19500 [Myxococcales bacterium]|nr:hypothetical protein [Myxococcales bacterium]